MIDSNNYYLELAFNNADKCVPGLKHFFKTQNYVEFGDRMRGYLGLPRIRRSVKRNGK